MSRLMRFTISTLLVGAAVIRAQAPSSLQALQEHLVGTWVGENHDYTKRPAVTTEVTIVVTKNKNAGRLDMVFSHQDPGKKEQRLKRSMIFDSSTSTVLIDRKSEDYKAIFRAAGLVEFLRTAYGDLTLTENPKKNGLSDVVGRYDYHLSPDHWRIEAYRGEVGEDDVGDMDKTGDWNMHRVAATN